MSDPREAVVMDTPVLQQKRAGQKSKEDPHPGFFWTGMPTCRLPQGISNRTVDNSRIRAISFS